MSARNVRIRTLGLFIAALTVRVLLYQPVSTPDSSRFLHQATHLLAGEGFRTHGVLETSLPPGYPVFLGAVISVLGAGLIRPLQVLLGALLPVLVYRAIRKRSEPNALAAAFILAAHPWLAAISGAILSEVLGVFVCGLMMFLLALIETDRATVTSFFCFGAMTVILILISPAAMFLSALLWIHVAVAHFKSMRRLISLALGSLAIMLPWQAHAIQATGGPVLTIFTPSFDTAANAWMRSWLVRERDMRYRYHPELLYAAPKTIFESEAERRSLLAAREMGGAAYSAALAKAGADRATADPLAYYVLLPGARAIALWADMPQLMHAQMEYVGRADPWSLRADAESLGYGRALPRLAKGLVSTLAYIFYVSVPLGTLVIAGLAVRKHPFPVLAITVGILLYTAISAYFANAEARRNLVFFPAMAFTAFYCAREPSS